MCDLHPPIESFPHYPTNIPHLSVDNFIEEKGEMTKDFEPKSAG